MRHALLPLLLVAALLAAAASPALAADGPRSPTGAERQEERDDRDSGRSGEAPGATHRPDDKDDGDGDDDRSGHGGDDRREVAPVGAFAVEQRAQKATGEYVTFAYNATGVQDFAAGGVTLFNLTVEPDAERGRAGDSRIRATGAQMRLDLDGFRFVAHDSPTAVARAQLDGAVRVDFVPAATVTPLDGERVRFTIGNLSGTLKGDDLVVRGNSVSAEEHVLVFLDTPRGAFDVHRQDIGQAISKGHVGAEATITGGADELKQDVVSYGNVTMTTVKAERGNLTLLVEGHGLEGRVLVLNVDGRVLGAAKAEDLNILLDNLTIQRADNLTDILDPDDDGYLPEYYIVHDPISAPDAYQLIVTVPHYSVHTLSVTTAFVLPPPSVVVGIVAGLVVLVPSAFVLFRRK